MVGVLEPDTPLWLQRYEKSEPSMNIHGPAELNTSYQQFLFTVRMKASPSLSNYSKAGVFKSMHEIKLENTLKQWKKYWGSLGVSNQSFSNNAHMKVNMLAP